MEDKKLEKGYIDEKTGISYTLVGDYYIPNLVLEQDEKVQLNKYGLLRLNYLKEHKKAEYTILLFENKLNSHLKEVQETAQKRVNDIIKKLKANSNLSEELKDYDPLYWTGMMNNFKNEAEEIVYKELIYV